MQPETHRATEMLSRILLLISVSASLSSCCRVAPITECSSPPFVPGHNLVGEGFNIVNMKTTGAFVVNVQDYITGGEHGNCTICKNTLLNREEKLPSAVTDWRIKVGCKRSISSRIFESLSSVMKQSTSTTSVSWKVGLGVPLVAGVAVGGTHSKSSTFARTHASQDKFFYANHQVSCRYYSLRVKANPPLTKEFLQSVNSLPVPYNAQADAAYRHFISVYGTHYLRHVKLGGRVQSTTAVRTCQVSMTGLSVHDVSNCLSAEASVVIEGIEVKGKTGYCRSKQNQRLNKNSFSSTFTDRVTEIWGGKGANADLLFSPDKQHGYTAWMKTLQTDPGVVSYTLSALHLLVTNNPVRKKALGEAITKYIMSNAIPLSCSSNCRTGHRTPQCSCKCGGHQNINSNCCPSHPGVATLTVKVVRAAGLYGDYTSKTDGYVKVFYEKKGQETPVIWNNDFPNWNYEVQFGTVNLASKERVRFEVWDRDNRWDDDRLGVASIIPTRGVNVQRQFPLKHGSLFVSITAICGPHLQGEVCERYAPSPEVQPLLTYSELLQKQRHTWAGENYGTVRNATML